MTCSHFFSFVVFSLASLALGCVVLLSVHFEMPVSMFTRDPLAVAGGHPLYGVLSNLGILYWTAAASVCSLTAFVLLPDSGRSKWGGFFLFFGLFSSLLLLDDLFMLHESIFTQAFAIGEYFFFGFYAVVLLTGLHLFAPQISESNYIFLLVAFSFFSCSILVDQIPEDWSAWHFLFEDGLKFLGTSSWTAYFAETALSHLDPSGNVKVEG